MLEQFVTALLCIPVTNKKTSTFLLFNYLVATFDPLHQWFRVSVCDAVLVRIRLWVCVTLY